MKLINSNHSDHEMEREIDKAQSQTDEMARNYGKWNGERNLPKAVGDNLAPYIGEIKAKYEELGARIHQKLQPDAHLPQVKMKTERAGDKDTIYASEIGRREQRNENDRNSIGDYHPQHIASRIRIALLATGFILIGEIVFNVKAFEFISETLLFSLLISFSLSFTVFLLSHIAPLLYKGAPTRARKWAVIIGTLTLATALFTALAILRSMMYATENINIKPVWFVVLNLFFFIVSCLLSYYLLPPWEEIKQHLICLAKYRAIKKRNKEIEQYKGMREENKDSSMHDTLGHVKGAIYAKHLDERIVRMSRKSIEIFKTSNILARTDGEVPTCFNEYYDDPDISFKATESINSERKLS